MGLLFKTAHGEETCDFPHFQLNSSFVVVGPLMSEMLASIGRNSLTEQSLHREGTISDSDLIKEYC